MKICEDCNSQLSVKYKAAAKELYLSTKTVKEKIASLALYKTNNI